MLNPIEHDFVTVTIRYRWYYSKIICSIADLKSRPNSLSDSIIQMVNGICNACSACGKP